MKYLHYTIFTSAPFARNDRKMLRSMSIFRNVEDKQKGIAGMMAAFFLIIGIFFGILFSLPVTVFVEQAGSYVPHCHHKHASMLAFENATTPFSQTTAALIEMTTSGS